MPEKTNSKKVLWIMSIVVVLAGLGIGGYFIYKKQLATTNTAGVSPTPSNIVPSGPKISSKDNPKGPYFHQIYSATSTDGLTWVKQDKLLFDHASVPGAVIKNDKIYLYFVDASGDEDQLSVAISSDNGKSFSEKQRVKVQDAPIYAVIDPHPQLVNDKIRLYYLYNPMNPNGEESKSFKMYSAVSADGINFDDPKVAFEYPELITDPDVFQTETDWRMFVSRGQDLILAIFTDGGITFTIDKNFSWNKGGVCDTVKMGNVYRTYFCGQGGIGSALGAETGKLIVEDGIRIESVNNQIVCDPSVIQLSDGTYLMFYKSQIPDKNTNSNQSQSK